MSGEVSFGGPATAQTCYFNIHGSGSAIWSTSGGTGAFEAFNSGNWTSYNVSAVEQGVSNLYIGDFPLAVPAGVYGVDARQQVGGTAAQTDRRVAAGDVQWNGSKTTPLSDLATSGQLGSFAPIRLARGVALSGFMLKLVSSTDHVTPFTSGIVSGQVSRDGGNFGALQSGTISEVGRGWYKVNLTSGDLLATTAALSFSANGVSGGTSDQRDMLVILQKVSGSV